MDYWDSGELPDQYRLRRPQQKSKLPQPLPPGEQRENRRQLLDYLQLELQLLESQLDLEEEPAALKQLSRQYPMDGQGRLVYPLTLPLPAVEPGANPFFLPPAVLRSLREDSEKDLRLSPGASDNPNATPMPHRPQTPRGPLTTRVLGQSQLSRDRRKAPGKRFRKSGPRGSSFGRGAGGNPARATGNFQTKKTNTKA